MAMLVEVQTKHGPILVEVSRQSASRQVASPADQIVKAAESLGDGFNKLAILGNEFADFAKQMGKKIKKAELEIGFELSGEGSFFFASAKAGATFSAKMEFDLTTA